MHQQVLLILFGLSALAFYVEASRGICDRFPQLENCEELEALQKRKSAYMRFGRSSNAYGGIDDGGGMAMEKRKSAYMRFGKRAIESSDGDVETLFGDKLSASASAGNGAVYDEIAVPLAAMEKRKSAYMRFGKRKSAYMRFGKRSGAADASTAAVYAMPVNTNADNDDNNAAMLWYGGAMEKRKPASFRFG